MIRRRWGRGAFRHRISRLRAWAKWDPPKSMAGARCGRCPAFFLVMNLGLRTCSFMSTARPRLVQPRACCRCRHGRVPAVGNVIHLDAPRASVSCGQKDGCFRGWHWVTGTTKSLHPRRSAPDLPARPPAAALVALQAIPARDRAVTAIHDVPNASGVAIDQVGPPARATQTQLRHLRSQSMLPPSTPSFLRRKSPNRSASARTSATASGRA